VKGNCQCNDKKLLIIGPGDRNKNHFYHERRVNGLARKEIHNFIQTNYRNQFTITLDRGKTNTIFYEIWYNKTDKCLLRGGNMTAVFGVKKEGYTTIVSDGRILRRSTNEIQNDSHNKIHRLPSIYNNTVVELPGIYYY
jgi:hypothetical protein